MKTSKLFLWQVGYTDEIEGRWVLRTGTVRASSGERAEKDVRVAARDEGWHDSELYCEIAIAAVPESGTLWEAEGDFGGVTLDANCTECGEPCDDGEGWDGLCGNCADKAEGDDE